MNPISWLCSALDRVNRDFSTEKFKLLKMEADTISVLHIESGEIWHFSATSRPDARRLSRTSCEKYTCNLPPNHVGPCRGACGCINGCMAMDCPNA